jgi:hypothetical protein
VDIYSEISTVLQVILQTLPGLCNIYVPGCRILSKCLYTQDRTAEIETLTHRKLIGCSMTAPPRVLSSSSKAYSSANFISLFPRAGNRKRGAFQKKDTVSALW